MVYRPDLDNSPPSPASNPSRMKKPVRMLGGQVHVGLGARGRELFARVPQHQEQVHGAERAIQQDESHQADPQPGGADGRRDPFLVSMIPCTIHGCRRSRSGTNPRCSSGTAAPQPIPPPTRTPARTARCTAPAAGSGRCCRPPIWNSENEHGWQVVHCASAAAIFIGWYLASITPSSSPTSIVNRIAGTRTIRASRADRVKYVAVPAVPQLPGGDSQHDGGAVDQRREQDLGISPDEHRVGEDRPDVGPNSSAWRPCRSLTHP